MGPSQLYNPQFSFFAKSKAIPLIILTTRHIIILRSIMSNLLVIPDATLHVFSSTCCPFRSASSPLTHPASSEQRHFCLFAPPVRDLTPCPSHHIFFSFSYSYLGIIARCDPSQGAKLRGTYGQETPLSAASPLLHSFRIKESTRENGALTPCYVVVCITSSVWW